MTKQLVDLHGGTKLALWARGDLAHDAGLPRPRARPEAHFTLGHNVRSEREVEAVMAQAQAAGARIVKPAGKTFWGGPFKIAFYGLPARAST